MVSVQLLSRRQKLLLDGRIADLTIGAGGGGGGGGGVEGPQDHCNTLLHTCVACIRSICTNQLGLYGLFIDILCLCDRLHKAAVNATAVRTADERVLVIRIIRHSQCVEFYCS